MKSIFTKPDMRILLLLVMQIVISCHKPTELELRLSEKFIFNQILENGDVKDYNLIKETEGKIVVIEFWGPHCGPCIKNMQKLRQLDKQYPHQLKVICVSDKPIELCEKFIKKKRFPFVFLHDDKNVLTKIFPHKVIPYSIVVNQKGKILKENVANQNTIDLIEGLITSDMPVVKNQQVNINEKSPLISFQLSRHDNSEIGHSVSSAFKKVPIITDEDTIVEIIQTSDLTGCNILQLYEHALGVTAAQIDITDDISYINSTQTKDLYDMLFSCSNTYGDFQKNLIKHLNTSFGLSTKVIKKERSYYEIVDIEVKPDTIEILNDRNFKQKGTSVADDCLFIAKGNFSITNISHLIEQFNEKRFNKGFISQKYPVVTSLEGDYVLNIRIADRDANQESWLRHFEKNGIKLLKKQGEFEFIEISKQQ